MKGSKGGVECVTTRTAALSDCEVASEPGIEEPYGVTVSPDGKNVYVASRKGEDVAEFARNTTTGALRKILGACIGGHTASGECPLSHKAIGLVEAIGVVVSPDGKDLYVAAGGGNEEGDVAAFAIEAAGVLKQLPGTQGCYSEGISECTPAVAMRGSEDLAISADGNDLYATSYEDDAVVGFAREAGGALAPLSGGSGCASTEEFAGHCRTVKGGEKPLGVALSPDGQNLYVGSSGEGAVEAYARDPASGEIEPLAEPDECVAGAGGLCGGSGKLAQFNGLIGLEEARRLTVSPDGTNVYVASQQGRAIAELSRTVAPQVTKLTPDAGSEFAQTPVTIEGTGFSEGDEVLAGGVKMPSTVTSAGEIDATIGPGSSGAVPVEVVNEAGEGEATFTFTASSTPTVTSIAPASGPEPVGTEVTITGTEFGPESTVMFGSREASAVTLNSPTSITATSPFGTGAVPVTVETDAGRSTASTKTEFRYVPGAIDLASYCDELADEGGVTLVKGSSHGPQFAYDNWACVTGSDGPLVIANKGAAPSMADACARRYPGVLTFAYPEEEEDASSWGCHLTPSPEREREREPLEHEPAPEPGGGGGGTGPPISELLASELGLFASFGGNRPLIEVNASIASSRPENVPPPKLAKTGNVEPVSGRVLLRVPGAHSFVSLSTLRQVPFGTVIEATHGRVLVTTVAPHGGPQTGEFFGGEFILRQSHSGLVVAELIGGNFSVCPTARERSHVASASAAHAPGKHVVRKLWANAHGSFSTQDSYAAGAVQGAEWLTEDLCEGTLIRVIAGRGGGDRPRQPSPPARQGPPRDLREGALTPLRTQEGFRFIRRRAGRPSPSPARSCCSRSLPVSPVPSPPTQAALPPAPCPSCPRRSRTSRRLPRRRSQASIRHPARRQVMR